MRGGEVSVGNALRLALTSIMRSRSDTRCGESVDEVEGTSCWWTMVWSVCRWKDGDQQNLLPLIYPPPPTPTYCP